MNMIRGIIPPALALAALLSGCQHIPPEPLNLAAITDGLHDRPLDIEPVQDYAARLLSHSSGAPDAFDVADGISMPEAQAIALWYNADLRVARMEADQAAGVAAQSGAWEDPQLGFSGGEKETAETTSGLLHGAGALSRSWISASTLSLTIPLSGRPRAARKVDGLAHQALEMAALEAEWQTLGAVREAWLRWSSLQQEIQLLESHLPMLENVASNARALADAGELYPTAARLFAIELASAQSMLINTQSLEADARFALLNLMGLTPTAPIELVPTMHLDRTKLDAHAPFESEPEHHPAIERRKAEYALAEAQLELELRKQYPDLTLSPEYVKEQDETSLALGLGIPLPTWNANRRGIAEALGARNVARARFEAAVLGLHGERERAKLELEATTKQREHLDSVLAPMLDDQLRELNTLLSVGELDLLVFFEALQQMLQAKQKIIHALLAHQLAASRMMNLYAVDSFLPASAQESTHE